MLPANRYETDVRALEDGAHAVGDGLRIAVRLPRGGQLLELVEEEDQLLPVRHRHPLGQLEREVERALGILRGEPGVSASSTPSPSSPTIFSDRARLRRRQRRAARASRTPQCAVRRGAIGDHGGRERLGQLAGIREAEQVELRRVGAPAREPAERRLADARLAGAARPGHHQMRARLEPGGDLAHVVAAADQLSGRNRRIRREQVAAGACRVVAVTRESLHKVSV